MRARGSPSLNREIGRQSGGKQCPPSTKQKKTSAVSSPARFQRQTPKIKKHYSTPARRSTTHVRHTNAVELCLSEAGSRRKISKPRNSNSPLQKTNSAYRNKPSLYEPTL